MLLMLPLVRGHAQRGVATWQVTDSPNVFTSTQLDPVCPSAAPAFQATGRRLFDEASPRYVSPEELGYKLPDQRVPEFAFLGRSNVGKSSLISALIGHQHKLVKVSKTPGATRNINYFAVSKSAIATHKPDFYLIDLPGYGFARAAKTEASRWKSFIQVYLRARDLTTLRRVFVLVDSRHGLKLSDVEMMQMLDELALPYEVVLTKADAASTAEKEAALASAFAKLMRTGSGSKLNCGLPFVTLVSSKDGSGLLQLKASIAEQLSFDWGSRRGPTDVTEDNLKLAQELLSKNPGLVDPGEQIVGNDDGEDGGGEDEGNGSSSRSP